MSIFSMILSKIFPSSAPAASAAVKAQPIDVEGVLGGLAGKRLDKLNWKSSIVDLLKLLDLDSGLSARQKLAKELGYSGDSADSATMNLWLQKQVMQKLADNGGKVPQELRH